MEDEEDEENKGTRGRRTRKTMMRDEEDEEFHRISEESFGWLLPALSLQLPRPVISVVPMEPLH